MSFVLYSCKNCQQETKHVVYFKIESPDPTTISQIKCTACSELPFFIAHDRDKPPNAMDRRVEKAPV